MEATFESKCSLQTIGSGAEGGTDRLGLWLRGLEPTGTLANAPLGQSQNAAVGRLHAGVETSLSVLATNG